MRTFIAIELPKETKDALYGLKEQLKTNGADVKWVEPDNIHLTLKFLGERDEKKIKDILRVLDEIYVTKTNFCASISCLGAFPKLECARIIWAGINKGDAQIKEIAGKLEERIAKLGICLLYTSPSPRD